VKQDILHVVSIEALMVIARKSKALSIMAPAVRNSLSQVTKRSTTITTFKTYLKIELCTVNKTRSNISSAAGASDSNSQIWYHLWMFLTFNIWPVACQFADNRAEWHQRLAKLLVHTRSNKI